MNGIIINDECYQLVTPQIESCDNCALDKFCDKFKEAICDILNGGDRGQIFKKVSLFNIKNSNIMKQIQLFVPDNQAELFAEKLSALIKECGGNIGDEKKADIFDTNIPIWERIKTVEDAIAYTGMTLPDNIEELPLDVQAMMKLRIICAAYNELKADQLDQFPKFTEDEYRYYPWCVLYTQEEIDAMNEEDRSRVLGRSGNNASAGAGVAYSFAGSAASGSYTYVGGRLCFKTEKLASECGKRFLKLWGQFYGFLGEEVKTF